MEQSERIKELDRFKAEEINILVASDVAARGLDIKGVSHVFNFDVPWQPDDYVHRIGRTGRAGKTGIAVTLATKDDAEAIGKIEKLSGNKIPEVGDPATAAAIEAPVEDAAPAEKKPRRARGGKASSGEMKPAREADEPAAEEAAPREAERPARQERAPREDRQPREARPREDRPRDDRPRANSSRDQERRPREQRQPEPEGEEEGWNGPVPSFLSQGFGG
jgi:superfamily II DNA/RNA helicase